MRKAVFALIMSACLMLMFASAAFAAGADVAEVNGVKYQDLTAAINAADDGDTVKMLGDVTITSTLTIDKRVTLDLGGGTLTINTGWGGISAKGGCSIRNGQINYNGNVAAIRVWNAGVIEDITIQVKAKDAGKTTGGIVLQEGSTTRIDAIRDTVIRGATNGIETYNCGNAATPVIGSMENVTIEAEETGMLLSAPCGTATNCSIYGAEYGVNMHLKGTYSVAVTLKGCNVTGGESAIYITDEESRDPNKYENVGSISLNVDSKTTLTSENGSAPIKSIIHDEGKLDEAPIFPDVSDVCMVEINGVVHHYGEHVWETNPADHSQECVNCGKKILPPPVEDLPKTGDESNLALFALLLTMSAAGMLAITRRRSSNRI